MADPVETATRCETPKGPWALVRVCAVLFALLSPPVSVLRARGPGKDQVDPKANYEDFDLRAAFLFAFSKYTEWPESSLPPGGTFIIGVMGEDPFGPFLESRAAGAMEGRKVVVKRFRNASEVQACHILYFPSSEERLVADLKDRLAARSVLTIGETSFFIGFGGALQLFNEGGRLRFVVNRAVLDRSKLRVEARALSLAKRVINQP